MKNPVLLFACLYVALSARAQCPPQLLNCPAAPHVICDSTDNSVLLWNESAWWDPLAASHNLAESPANLCLTVVDTCPAGSLTVKYRLYLDLDADGTAETIVDSDSLPGWNTVFYNNANADSLPGGTPRPFDERPVLPALKYGFAIETTASGDTLRACVRWNTEQTPGDYTVPELPYGAHRIVWTLTHDGASQSCTDSFSIVDCKQPEVVCLPGLSVNIMPTAMILLWNTDFLQYAQDNVTPAQQIKLGVRRSGTGAGFPLNPDGTPQSFVLFTCNDLGTQLVELWAKDLAGNADFCETYVIVQDNLSNCVSDPMGLHSICVETACTNKPMEGVSVEIAGSSPALPPFIDPATTGPGGCLVPFSLPISNNYTVTPILDSDPLDGVSTFDLVLINKHILGIEPLNSPYKMLAADVNQSRSITTFDVIETRKLLLGIYTEFPNNTSWRFLPKDFVFPNPANPFLSAVPDSAVFSGASIDFLGIKVGDVNCNASLNSFAPPAEDRAVLVLTLPDCTLSAGQVLEIPLRVSEAGAWLGFQLALQFDPAAIELERILPGALPAMDEAAFAQPYPGVATASWFDAVPRQVEPDRALASFRIRAKAAVRLSDAVRLLPKQLAPEAYAADERVQDLQLYFSDPAGDAPVAIYAPQPNPTAADARIAVQSGQEVAVRLEVFDLAGRLIYQWEKQQFEGLQQIPIPASALTKPGVYTWRVQAGQTIRSGKLLRM